MINDMIEKETQNPQTMGQPQSQDGMMGGGDTLTKITRLLETVEKILNNPYVAQKLGNKNKSPSIDQNPSPKGGGKPPKKGKKPPEGEEKSNDLENIDKQKVLESMLKSPTAVEDVKGFIDLLINAIGDIKLSELKKGVPELIQKLRKLKGVDDVSKTESKESKAE